MKISIIIPVYNVEKYLERCLKSAVNQTWKNVEIIAVDNASSDKSKNIMEKYEKKYPEIVKMIYLSENAGPGGARNRGIDVATGEYITFLDSDDYLDATMCEKMLQKAQETDSDIVYCDCFRDFEGKNKKNWTSYQYEEEMGEMSESKYWLQLLNYGYVWGKLIRTSMLRKNEIIFPAYKKYEDFAFAPLMILYAKRTAYIKEPLYNYVIRESSVMTTRNVEYHKDIAMVGDYLCRDLCNRGLEKYAKILQAIAYYKAVKLAIDKNDNPDISFIISITQKLELFYHEKEELLFLFHELMEIEIIEAARKSPQLLEKKIWDEDFAEKNVDYDKYYRVFEQQIVNIFQQFRGKQIAIWGYGKKGKSFLNNIRKQRIGIPYIIDRNKELQGVRLATGEEITSFEQVSDLIEIIVVINRNYFSAIEKEIKDKADKVVICNLEAEIMQRIMKKQGGN